MRRLTLKELNLLTSALNRAASRHESEAKYYPKQREKHTAIAKAMRELETSISEGRVG